MTGCEDIRGEFPALQRGIVYLDNAASTLKPRSVVEAMAEFALEHYSNVHRAHHRLAVEATEAYERARARVASFLGASEREVVFTPQGTTMALHWAVWLAAANGLVRPGSLVVVPGDAHNSLLLSARRVAEAAGARLWVSPVGRDGVPDWEAVEKVLDEEDVSILALSHVSNVTGVEAPVAGLAARARRRGALVVLDAAQSAPHGSLRPGELGVDMAAFSPHKMLGPTGIGVLWIRGGLAERLEPAFPGGGTVARVSRAGDGVDVEWEEPPWRFEPGTPPVIEAVGAAAAVEFLERFGPGRVRGLLREAADSMVELLSRVEGVELVGPREGRVGIVSFNLRGLDPDIVGMRLAARGIAVRSGHHCAGLLYEALGLERGSVRASAYIYNCPGDYEALASAVASLARG